MLSGKRRMCPQEILLAISTVSCDLPIDKETACCIRLLDLRVHPSGRTIRLGPVRREDLALAVEETSEGQVTRLGRDKVVFGGDCIKLEVDGS